MTREFRGDDTERVLSEKLRFGTRRPTHAHDQTVLDAAKKAAEKIRAKKPGGDSAGGGSGTATSRRWFVPAALVASLVVGVAGLLSLQIRPGTDLTTVSTRNGTSGEVTPGHQTTLTTAPSEFHWPSNAMARSYQLTLLDSSAEVLWTSEEVGSNHVVLPDAVRGRLTGGSTYLWTVEVQSGGASTKLGPFWFRMSP